MMNRLLYKQKAHDILRDWSHIVVYLVFFAITVLVAVPTAVLTRIYKDSAAVTTICSVIDSLVGLLILPAVSVVMYNYFINLSRGKVITLKEAFGNALPDRKAYFRLVVSHLAYTVIVAVGFILLIVPGIIALVYMMFGMYRRAMNPDLPILQDLQESYELVRGRWSEFASFALSFIGWLLLVAITGGIASVWVSPYYMLCKSMMMDARYNELHPEEATDEKASAAPCENPFGELGGSDAPCEEQESERPEENRPFDDSDPFGE